jgi:hypothetical protein
MGTSFRRPPSVDPPATERESEGVDYVPEGETQSALASVKRIARAIPHRKVQRKAAPGEEKKDAAEKEAEVSEPGEPVEKEADAVSDKVAGDLHDDKKQEKEEKGGKDDDETKEKAPPIGAKLEGVGLKIHRSKDDKITDKSEHAKDRKEEGKTDANRQVGDANRVVREGRKFEDTETGNLVFVNGDRVVITTKEGKQVTQFTNTRANTQMRIRTGKWKPID